MCERASERVKLKLKSPHKTMRKLNVQYPIERRNKLDNLPIYHHFVSVNKLKKYMQDVAVGMTSTEDLFFMNNINNYWHPQNIEKLK